MNSAAKTKKAYLFLSMILLIAAVVVYLAFGLAPSMDHNTYKRYTASIPYEFDTETLPALSDAINGVAGTPVTVNMAKNISGSKDVLEILVIPAADIDEKAVVDLLGSEYAEMEIEELVQGVYSPAFTADKLINWMIVYGLALVLIFVLMAFVFDAKNGLAIIISQLLTTALTAAIYIICRVPHVRMLLVAVMVGCILTPYFCTVKVRSLNLARDRQKKTASLVDAARDSADKTARQTVDTLVVCAVVCLAFAVVGLIVGTAGLAYYGVMLFAAMALSIYVSALVTPVIWAGFNRK